MTLYGSRSAVERTPTFAINLTTDSMERLKVKDPSYLTQRLNQRGVACTHGNHYAVELVDNKMGLKEGVTRISLLHYNAVQEVEKVVSIIQDICN